MKINTIVSIPSLKNVIDSGYNVCFSFSGLSAAIRDQYTNKSADWRRSIFYQNIWFEFIIYENRQENAIRITGRDFQIYIPKTGIVASFSIGHVTNNRKRFWTVKLPAQLQSICDQMIIYQIHQS